MKFIVKILAAGVAVFGLVGGAAFSVSAESVLASKETALDFSSYKSLSNEQDTKYSANVMRAVRIDLGIEAESTQLDNRIREMPKVQVMDHYLSTFGKKIKGNEVRLAVEEIFEIDLAYISKNDYGSKLAIYPANVMESLRTSFHEQPDSIEKDAYHGLGKKRCNGPLYEGAQLCTDGSGKPYADQPDFWCEFEWHFHSGTFAASDQFQGPVDCKKR